MLTCLVEVLMTTAFSVTGWLDPVVSSSASPSSGSTSRT